MNRGMEGYEIEHAQHDGHDQLIGRLHDAKEDEVDYPDDHRVQQVAAQKIHHQVVAAGQHAVYAGRLLLTDQHDLQTLQGAL